MLGDVAADYLTAGAVDQAVEVGRRALAAALEAETTMGRVRLSALADQLPASSAAQAFRDEIRAFLE
ncbi:hypothetical protein [Kitasatospora sp. NBC_01300]|uniref:hypothetical protein n=1 Tax=Kitasatospora sp. NBC_01300 TaxID=2903574 RepID=UPI002F909857|nr:hypothetical protein OG556_37195 [Kitasatospora sp. NBC_01300]